MNGVVTDTPHPYIFYLINSKSVLHTVEEGLTNFIF
jgi:hypothetical protein